MNKIKMLVATMFAAAMFASCSLEDVTGEFSDAPVSGSDDSPAEIIMFNDGFGNVAAKCHGPNMVYSSKVPGDGRSIDVVGNDPRCANG